ncbi:MAG: lysophospholipid acyltransferase family protein [Candidatus Cyclobacteriaceae bacterium M3_2C_046]
MPFIKLLSYLPLPLLYILADLIYLVIYYLVGYRKKVVLKNLRNSFPDKTEQEISAITKRFYKNFADVMVEVIKGYSISASELKKRVQTRNIEDLDQFYDQGTTAIAMLSHQCNWEWVNLISSMKLRAKTVYVYQQIKSNATDEFMNQSRSRFGAIGVEKKESIKDIIKLKNTITAIGLISDQIPGSVETRFWTQFLNQPTAFFEGAQVIGHRLGYPVYFVGMKRIKRGYYEVFYEKIDTPPWNPEENFILKQYVQKLEKMIRQDPASWLWTHNRWKRPFRKEIE